jgi:thymidylate synthase ThyX
MGLAAESLREIDTLVTDPVGRVIDLFPGIGRFRGRKEYTPQEEIILGHFFTNTRSNVYAATDNLPGELRALLLGQYARSQATGRDRLLKLFRDMEKAEEINLDEFASAIESNKETGGVINLAEERAARFIDKHGGGVEGYGHASLRDSATVCLFFEGASQRATKELESSRLGAYQEQSTRAIPFTEKNLGVPYEIRGTEWEEKVAQLDLKLISLYQQVNERMIPYLENNFSHLRTEADERMRERWGSNFQQVSDRTWESSLKAKGFDVARSLLPQNMTTSLGMVLNTRCFQDQLTAWQSHPIKEVRALGRAAQLEASKVSPNLLKYGEPSEFYLGLPENLRTLYGEVMSTQPHSEPYAHKDPTSRMVGADPNLESKVLASILLNSSHGRHNFKDLIRRVNGLPPSKRKEIAQAAMAEKGQHDLYPKLVEVGSVTFERDYDIGSFRDLQRQRGDTQQRCRYGTHGYQMPPEIAEIGLEKEFIGLMGEVKTLYNQMLDAGLNSAAEYLPVMANRIRHVVTEDLAQVAYVAGLRTQPAGHDSYRAIAIQETEQALTLLPAFRDLITFDSKETYTLGRLEEHILKSRPAK